MTLAISTGDPNGVGPELSVAAAAHCAQLCVLFGDARRLRTLAETQRIDSARLVDQPVQGPFALGPGEIGLADVGRWPDPPDPREPTAHAGRAQLRALEAAAAATLRGAFSALVTAPVSKQAVVLGGTPFSGQTEHLAAQAGLATDAVTMMFLGEALRVALVTTHVALRDAPALVTEARVIRTACHTAEALLRLRSGHAVCRARVVVAGLNPHAGENGLFGFEEQRVLAPAIARARALEPFASGRAEVRGPVPAEAALREAVGRLDEAVVVMTHDQGTIAAKLLDWGKSVNVTWGLPYVRTSVDHGVAYAIAGTGNADRSGMDAAILRACELSVGPEGQ